MAATAASLSNDPDAPALVKALPGIGKLAALMRRRRPLSSVTHSSSVEGANDVGAFATAGSFGVAGAATEASTTDADDGFGAAGAEAEASATDEDDDFGAAGAETEASATDEDDAFGAAGAAVLARSAADASPASAA